MARLMGGPVVTGLVAGVVGGLIAPVIPRSSLRSAAKALIRGAIVIYERGREATATWAETASDLVAEVQIERAIAAMGNGAQGSETVTPIKRDQATAPLASDG
jgi:hypothetical protein